MGTKGAIDMKTAAPLLVVLAATCWGVIGLFSQMLAALGMDAIQITVIRCALAALFLGAYMLVANREAFRFALRDIWMFVGTGVLSIAFFNVCYFACIAECGLSFAAILLYTAPCFVVVMAAFFFHEHLTRRKVLALLLAFVGCLLVVGVGSGESSLSMFGVLVGLGSGLGYALYSLFARFALVRYRALTVMFYTFSFAACVLLPFADPVSIVLLGIADLPAALVMAGLALVSTLLPFAAYTVALRYMEAGKASIMAFIEPMVALIIGVSVFHDVLNAMNVGGIVLIVVAVALLNVRDRHKEKENPFRS